MTLELATKLSYVLLGLSFLVLCGSLLVLRRARKHLRGVEKMAEPWWCLERRDTLFLPNVYHHGS